jgi:peptidoglycan hydrolase-like protein with peptidoglycan-binding domain
MRNMPPRVITYAILQDTNDGNLLFLGTNLGVYRSTDRGASWAPAWAPTSTPEPKKKTPARLAKRQAVAPARRQIQRALPAELVTQIQQTLNNMGYHLGEPDGKLGPDTVAALKHFQQIVTCR